MKVKVIELLISSFIISLVSIMKRHDGSMSIILTVFAAIAKSIDYESEYFMQ